MRSAVFRRIFASKSPSTASRGDQMPHLLLRIRPEMQHEATFKECPFYWSMSGHNGHVWRIGRAMLHSDILVLMRGRNYFSPRSGAVRVDVME